MIKRMVDSVHYLFVPHERNNWKAKLLHHDFLTLAILFFLLLNVTVNVVIKQENPILGVRVSVSVSELLDETNRERTKKNLPPLRLSPLLEAAAQKKAADMFAKNYWAHYSPDGTTPWYFFDKIGYDYLSAGENLAKDFNTSDAIVRAWMGSLKHRENILSKDYEEIGFAVHEGYLLGQPTTLVVQLFAKPTPQFATQIQSSPPVLAEKTVAPQVIQYTERQPLIDAVSLQRYAVFLFLIGLIAAVSIDFYVLNKRGLFSFHRGKHIAHLTILITMLVSSLLVSRGFIL